MSNAREIQDVRRMGEAYAFALLQWPAVVVVMDAANDGWGLVFKIVCGIWVGLLSLAAIFGRREAGSKFGLATALCAALVAAFWASHPGPWMYLWLALLMLSFYAAQRARMEEPRPNPERDPTSVE